MQDRGLVTCTVMPPYTAKGREWTGLKLNLYPVIFKVLNIYKIIFFIQNYGYSKIGLKIKVVVQ